MVRKLGPLLFAGAMAFSTYFCMYAFRKPFTAATYDGQEAFGLAMKSALVIAQLLGYTVSKFLGISLVSGLAPQRRAIAIVALLLSAELALVGVAFVPAPLQVVCLFANGLPLGMVFGLVVTYLEGRRATEALAAVLCMSFITASGAVKSLGAWLLSHGVSEAQMPMTAGAIFLVPMLLSVWGLSRTPPPDAADMAARSRRPAMTRASRRAFLSRFAAVLVPLLLVFVALSVVRTIRDDYAVELWRDLGAESKPAVFAQIETAVAVVVLLLGGFTVWLKDHRAALRITVILMVLGFALSGVAVLLRQRGAIDAFAFMTLTGIGLYIPYVAFHTAVFERLIAVSRMAANLGFLMNLADAVAYLGYAVVILRQMTGGQVSGLLPFFDGALQATAAGCIALLLGGLVLLERTLRRSTGAGVLAPQGQA